MRSVDDVLVFRTKGGCSFGVIWISDHPDPGASKSFKGTDQSILVMDSSLLFMHHDQE